MTEMAGPYSSGKLYFYNDTITNSKNPTKIDSVMYSSARVLSSDSTVTVYDVPGRLLARGLKNHPELKKAMEDADPVDITSKFIFISINDYGYCYAYTYPNTVTYENLEYGGAAHKVEVKFYWPSSTQYYNKQMSYSMAVGGIYEDGTLVEQLYSTSGTEAEQKSAIVEFYGSKI